MSRAPRQAARRLPCAAGAASRFDRAWRLYGKRLQRCRTENQINRLHLVIENYMTPAELHRFDAALAAGREDSPGRPWIARLVRRMPVNKARAVEFERVGRRRGVTMYTAETEPRSKKTLIIGFAGHFHRLMLPMPVLLDCFDPAVYDVLVLRDFNRAFFARGIDGLGGDFVGAISNLRERFDPGSYRNAIALGTSSGGLPAVLGAVMLGLRRGVAVGGIDFPALTARLRNQGISEAVYARLLACRPQPFPDLILAYGADYAIDVASNRGLHGRVPSRLHAIEGCAIHGVLAWLVARGSLPAFLETVLDQSLETGNPTSPPRGAMDTVQLTKGDT